MLVGFIGHKPDHSPDFFHRGAVITGLLQFLCLDGLEGLRRVLQGVDGEGRIQARVDVLVAARAFQGRQTLLVDLSAFRGHLTVAVLQQEALPADLHRMGIHFEDVRERDELVHKLLSDHLLDNVLRIQKQTFEMGEPETRKEGALE